ncbi:hypothetical protein XENOCAPTIV_030545 [Xenoophorus captivus]|uniref:Uncharacterized protein n=1 Tax=Xenoophorus captivus TaxID=1517983 RepID=A0ABV0S4K4_9TELE
MASSISNLTFKILCDNDGCLEARQLNAKLAESSFGVKLADLRSVLFDDGKIAIREGILSAVAARSGKFLLCVSTDAWRCKRTHAIDEHGVKLFKGFSQGNIQSLYKIYRNKFIINGEQGSQGGGDTTVTSETLEKMYLADKDAEIPFQAGKHQYILHFKGAEGTQQMYQQNLQYQTKREIQRRPRFVSTQDVKDLRRYCQRHQFFVLYFDFVLVYLNIALIFILSTVDHHTAPAPPQLNIFHPNGTRMPYLIWDIRYIYCISSILFC